MAITLKERFLHKLKEVEAREGVRELEARLDRLGLRWAVLEDASDGPPGPSAVDRAVQGALKLWRIIHIIQSTAKVERH